MSLFQSDTITGGSSSSSSSSSASASLLASHGDERKQPEPESKGEGSSASVNDVRSAMRELNKAFTANNVEKQIEVLERVVQLSNSSKARMRAEIARNLRLILTLYASPSEALRLPAAKVINNLSKLESLKDNFRESGAIVELIKSLPESSEETQTLVLNAIGFLMTKNQKNAQALLDCDGVAPLVQLLVSHNPKIQFFAAACLWVIGAHGNAFQNAILEAGAVTLLLPLLESEDSDIAWQASGALRNLVVKNVPAHEAIALADGMINYVATLRKHLTIEEEAHEEKGSKVISMALQTLGMICNTEIVKDAFRESSAFSLMLDILNRGHVDHHVRVCNIITNACSKSTLNQDTFFNLDGLDELNRLLSSTNEDSRAAAANAMWAATASNETNLNYLVESLIFSRLLDQLHLETDRVLVGIIATITNVVDAKEETIDELIRGNVVPFIVDCLRGTHPPLLETAAGCLMLLIRRSEDILNMVRELDGPLLLARLVPSHYTGVKEKSSGCLRVFLESKDERTVIAIEETDILKVLLLGMKETEFPQIQMNCGACVKLLLQLDPIKFCPIFVKLNIHLSVGVFAKSPLEKLITCCAELVYHLAPYSDEIRNLLNHEELMAKLIYSIKREDLRNNTKIALGQAIWAMTLNNATHKQILKSSDGLKRILDLLFVDEDSSPALKTTLLRTLASACSNFAKNQDDVRKYPNAIAQIVALTDSLDDDLRLQNGCLAIWCLCINNNNNVVSFKDAGVATLLHKILEACEQYPLNDTLKTNVLGAIAILSSGNNEIKNALKATNAKTILQNELFSSCDNLAVKNQLKLALKELK